MWPVFPLAVFLCIQGALSQYNGRGYQRRYFVYRQPQVVVYPSGSGVRSTFVARPTLSAADAQKVRLDVFYETDCPDSMRYITGQLYKVHQEMDDIVDIHLVPYGKAWESYNAVSKRYDFQCHHGPSECYGNTVQSCVISMYPAMKDKMNFIKCMESYPRPSHNGQKCARRHGLDWAKIEKCATGDEGNRLLHENALLTDKLNPKLHFVPWTVVDQVYSAKNQRQSMRDLTKVVCDAYKGSTHPKCL